MSNSGNWNMCQIFWWAIAALVGLSILLGTTEAVGFIAALMAGAAMAVFGGLVLTRLFCTNASQPATGAASGETSQAPAQKPVETSVAKKVEDSVADAADTAKASAEKTVEQVKETGSDAANTAAAAAEKTADAAKTAAQNTAQKAEVAGAAAAKATTEAAADVGSDYDGDGVKEGTDEGARPEVLSAPRDGQADDLKQIKGIGPKLETMLNEMGFYHFDQIAGWSADEVAWVNANLQGFKGRATRDNWVEQAGTLAAGGETEFSKRVEDGNVY